jgi:RHS repeat-associated protein
LNRETTYSEYDAFNNMHKVTRAGSETTFTYDDFGNLQSVRRPYLEGGSNSFWTTEVSFDPGWNGKPSAVNDTLLHGTRYAYDDNGYVDALGDSEDNWHNYNYSRFGRLDSVVDDFGNSNSYTYDAYGSVKLVTNEFGYFADHTYFDNGLLQTAKDANGNITTYAYYKTGQIKKVTYQDTTFEDYVYDGIGRLKSHKNATGQTTTYNYNDTNRTVTITDPLLRATTVQYDAVGNPALITDPSGRTTTFEYDEAYQLRKVLYSDPNTPDVEYIYDSRGRRDFMKETVGGTVRTTDYDYDSLDRLTSVLDSNAQRVDYAYDLGDRLTTVKYPYTGAPGSGTRTLTRTYYDNNWLKSVTDWLSNSTTFEYDYNGNLKVIRPTTPNANVPTTNVQYDKANQVLTMTHTLTSTPFLTFAYPTRDKIGLVKTSKEGTAGNHTYNYDNRNRVTSDALTKGTTTSTGTWNYKANAQINQSTYKPTAPTVPLTTTHTYDAAAQYKTLIEKNSSGTTTRSLSFTYSTTGNRTQQTNVLANQTTTYTYNQADRLTGYSPPVPQVPYTYTYDGEGLRMGKTASGVTQQYRWDVGVQAGRLPLLLQDGDASYIYGPGGLLLWQIKNTGNAVYRYQTDQLGSVRALTSSAGQVVNRYDYDAYGKLLTSSGTVVNPFRYAGQYTDTESGLIYLRARYYDPGTQQFLSRDPQEGASGQPYAYAAGSPLNATDASGQFWDWLPDALAIGLDVGDIIGEGLNWGNGAALLADVVLGPVPFIPAFAGWARRGGKMLAHADDLGGAINHAGDFVYLYHGSHGIVGGKFSLQLAVESRRAHHLTGEGIFFTDDVGRAIQEYAGLSGEVARVKVPRTMAERAFQTDRYGKVEYVFKTQAEVDVLNANLEILPVLDAMRRWW